MNTEYLKKVINPNEKYLTPVPYSKPVEKYGRDLTVREAIRIAEDLELDSKLFGRA